MFRGLSVNPTSGRVIMYIYKIGCWLVRGVSLPAAQLFVIAIENILWCVCGQFKKKCELPSKVVNLLVLLIDVHICCQTDIPQI